MLITLTLILIRLFTIPFQQIRRSTNYKIIHAFVRIIRKLIIIHLQTDLYGFIKLSSWWSKFIRLSCTFFNFTSLLIFYIYIIFMISFFKFHLQFSRNLNFTPLIFINIFIKMSPQLNYFTIKPCIYQTFIQVVFSRPLSVTF